jgi:predicted nucleic acid-binding protein
MIVVADTGPLHYLILLEHAELLHGLYGEVVVPVDADRVQEVTDELDLGERAAIVLAGTIHADLLLIDDAAGRAEAKRRNLRVTGTLGVLRAAAERGLVNVPELVARLKATTFYADEALLKSAFGRWLE